MVLIVGGGIKEKGCVITYLYFGTMRIMHLNNRRKTAIDGYPSTKVWPQAVWIWNPYPKNL